MEEMVTRLRSELFKAISHPTRLNILDYLKDGEQCVCDIIEKLDLEQSNVSQHLGILKKQGLLQSRKDGTKMMYKIKYPEILDIIKLSNNILSTQLNETQEMLQYFKD